MITQVVLHVSIILATVPSIKPWLLAFESGGLHAPAEAPDESATLSQHHRPPRRTPLPSRLSSSISLPKAADPALIRRSISHESNSGLTPSRAGPRARAEAWPLHTFPEQTSYSVTAEYAPELAHLPPTYQAPLRKLSKDSSPSGIIRTKSFSVQHEDVGDYFGRENGGTTIDEEMGRSNLVLRDVGGLLEQDGPETEMVERRADGN